MTLQAQTIPATGAGGYTNGNGHSAAACAPADASAFRHVMGHFPTGVTVIATACGGERFGMTANAVTAVSLEPLMILVCLQRGARTGQAIDRAGAFVVNILSADQQDVSCRFAKPGDDRFAGVEVIEDERGLPLLPGCVGYLICDVVDITPAGDHDIVLGSVKRCQANGGNPLIFFRGRYDTLTQAEAPV